MHPLFALLVLPIAVLFGARNPKHPREGWSYFSRLDAQDPFSPLGVASVIEFVHCGVQRISLLIGIGMLA